MENKALNLGIDTVSTHVVTVILRDLAGRVLRVRVSGRTTIELKGEESKRVKTLRASQPQVFI